MGTETGEDLNICLELTRRRCGVRETIRGCDCDDVASNRLCSQLLAMDTAIVEASPLASGGESMAGAGDMVIASCFLFMCWEYY
jgi:hypothetical protein